MASGLLLDKMSGGCLLKAIIILAFFDLHPGSQNCLLHALVSF